MHRRASALLVVAVVGLVGCGGDGGDGAPGAPSTTSSESPASSPAAPSGASAPASPSSGSTSSSPGGVVPSGFARVAATVGASDGSSCDVCLWLADEPDLRARGLMGVTDLGGLDGMAFVYDEPRTTSFTMRDTLLALSIAFYAPDGTFMDAFDMTPCTAEPCPGYATPEGFGVAVEVPLGGLGRFGMTAGSTLVLRPDGCPR